MAHIGTAELVSAVSNAGALGIIGCGFYKPDWVRKQIRLTRQKTDQTFGINILLNSPYVTEILEIILQEKVPIIATGVGNPEPYIPQLKQAGLKIIPVVASVTAARNMEMAGADAIVAEGMESGGTIGETALVALVPQVVDAVKIPVIAAGGIADGRGLAAAMALGAQGIQMGTRFVCSEESVAHSAYKQKILDADDRSTVITGRTTGISLRTLKNSLTEQFLALEQAGATREELNIFSSGRMHLGMIDGDVEQGSLLAGQIAGMITDIKPVKVIIEETVAEAEWVISHLNIISK